MGKLRQYLGWVIAGVIVVAAVGVFAGMTLPLYGEISDLTGEIEEGAGNLSRDASQKPKPKDEDIEGFNAAKGKLETKLRQVMEFYHRYDEPMEKWFPNLGRDPKDTPSPSQFRTEWITQRNQLDQKIRDWHDDGLGYHRPYDKADFKIDTGFNWENIEELKADDLDTVMMRLFMKRYWIRALIADIVTDPALGAVRLLEVDFLKKIDKFDPPPSAAGVARPEETIQHAGWDLGWLPGVEATTGRNATIDNEQVLPSDLGETLTFGVAVMLPYDKVPALIDRLLKVEEGKPLIHIVATRIYVHDQNQFTHTETVELGKKGERERELQALYASRPPVVAITAYAIDFK